MKFEDLVVVTRNRNIENIHEGVAVIIDSDGKIIKEWGDSTISIYPRSAIKPVQTFGIITSGTMKSLNISYERIALATSSHHGENIHTDMVRSWLDEMHLDENDLANGLDWPLGKKRKDYIIRNDGRKSKLLHNCSGKHCGQLAICTHKNWSTLNYHLLNHPAQKLFIDNLEELSEVKIKNIGVDGCNLPAPYMPLNKFAYTLARLADPQKLSEEYKEACNIIFDACTDFPIIAGGTESINSIITKLSNKKLFAKNGAEGVFGVMIPSLKVGIAIKIKDGNSKAAEVALAGVLKELNILDDAILSSMYSQVLTNSTGAAVGTIEWIKK